MSWNARLLPFLDRSELWTETVAEYTTSNGLPMMAPVHPHLSTVVPAFACPADARAGEAAWTPVGAPRELQKKAAFTSYLGVLGGDLYRLDGCLYQGSQVSMPEISDGTSQTLLVGERPPSSDLRWGWYSGWGQSGTGSIDMLLGVREVNLRLAGIADCPHPRSSYRPGAYSNPCDALHFASEPCHQRRDARQ